MVCRSRRGFAPLEFVAVSLLLSFVVGVVGYRLTLGDRPAVKSGIHQRNVAVISAAVERYRFERGAYPESLDRLVAEKFLSSEPLPPNERGHYAVNAANGRVSYVP